MDFNAVESGRGNKVTMFGVFMEIGGIQYTPQQKAKSICKIADDNGVSHNVHIYQGTGQLPQPAQLQQRHSFSLSTFEGNYQGKPYTGYSGFWQGDAQTRQQAPPQSPQAPQQPRQATNAPPMSKDASICRQTAGKVAGEIIACTPDSISQDPKQTANLVIDMAEPIAHWFLTGKKLVPQDAMDYCQQDESGAPPDNQNEPW